MSHDTFEHEPSEYQEAAREAHEDTRREELAVMRTQLALIGKSLGFANAADILDALRVDDLQTDAYADGRTDQFEEDRELLTWAYRKLQPFAFVKQEDALVMDRICLLITNKIAA